MGARIGGKIKTVTYILAGALALMASSVKRLAMDGAFYRWLVMAAECVFIISVIFAVVSFFDYVSIYKKAPDKENGTAK